MIHTGSNVPFMMSLGLVEAHLAIGGYLIVDPPVEVDLEALRRWLELQHALI